MAITSTWKIPVNHAGFKKLLIIFSPHICVYLNSPQT